MQGQGEYQSGDQGNLDPGKQGFIDSCQVQLSAGLVGRSGQRSGEDGDNIVEEDQRYGKADQKHPNRKPQVFSQFVEVSEIGHRCHNDIMITVFLHKL